MNSNEYIVSFIESFKNKPIKRINEQISILALVFGRRDIVGDSLSKMANKASINKIFAILEKAPESYIQSLVNYLEGQEIREELKTSLKRFKKDS